MDARLLYFGLLGSLATLFLPAVLGDWFIAELGLSFLMLEAVMGLAIILSFFGFVGKGLMDTDAAGGLLFGGCVVLALSSVFFVLALADYSRSLDLCQGLSAILFAADPRCNELQFSMGLMWIIASSVAVSAIITVASLVQLREFSGKSTIEQL